MIPYIHRQATYTLELLKEESTHILILSLSGYPLERGEEIERGATISVSARTVFNFTSFKY